MKEDEALREEVILVDDSDTQIGTLDKLSVHQQGLLHRAFSVFIFNSKGELLIQRRSMYKYHSPGLWTNTCCSHPRPGESTLEAVNRRLYEEMGITCYSKFQFNFTYRFEFENGLIEHEFDHVYFGETDQKPVCNRDEVMDWEYIDLHELEKDIQAKPEHFTIWLRICLPQVLSHFRAQQ